MAGNVGMSLVRGMSPRAEQSGASMFGGSQATDLSAAVALDPEDPVVRPIRLTPGLPQVTPG